MLKEHSEQSQQRVIPQILSPLSLSPKRKRRSILITLLCCLKILPPILRQPCQQIPLLIILLKTHESLTHSLSILHQRQLHHLSRQKSSSNCKQHLRIRFKHLRLPLPLETKKKHIKTKMIQMLTSLLSSLIFHSKIQAILISSLMEKSYFVIQMGILSHT